LLENAGVLANIRRSFCISQSSLPRKMPPETDLGGRHGEIPRQISHEQRT
jgi:hypothetical protein